MKPRLNRLFAQDGKCFDVAIDHGFFNEGSFLSGIENIEQAVATIVDAGPDAVQLTVGQARFLQRIPGKQKPSLVMRTDAGNFYNRQLPPHLFSHLIPDAVEQAVALDAACVVVNLLLLPGRPELYHESLRNVCALKPACERFGMPMMVEPLVMQPNETHGGYMVDGDLGKIVPLVRQAVELGADLIKADPCDDVTEYHRVVEAASGIPVLVRGGGLASDEEVLERTYAIMQQGASGIVYGRNVVQHRAPARMTKALMAIVHGQADAVAAAAMLREE
ncbi:class I fructose-bisphosphate aldolase [Paenibacillus cymbidii]|uniref:class I fructose-bisphosphate aldolase n=1 Tax=Paenibacillus cymbidii TaxID=1639034 RepID=UPI00108170A7|nr:aldolase [Paenibacillus cymbidii]